MLELLKRLMGSQKKSRRPQIDLVKLNAPVEAARLKLEAAQADHAALLEKHRQHATAEAIANAAFEAHGDDETADKLVELSRERAKQDLFKARSQRTVDRVAAAHKAAEVSRDATVLATLDHIYTQAHEHTVAEWESTGKPALMAFNAFICEVDAITSEADLAVRESARIRGEGDAWMKICGLQAQQAGVLREAIVRELGYPLAERIAQALRF